MLENQKGESTHKNKKTEQPDSRHIHFSITEHQKAEKPDKIEKIFHSDILQQPLLILL
jgi:hypothetical protein